jgi:hypothetical protein|tara:strand:- start:5459 stop:5611 length:153 start_codon:yes stop_codon:yes gene_type:complete
MWFLKTITMFVVLPFAFLFLALCATDESVVGAFLCIGGMFALEAWTEGGA